ncbi:MAG: transcription antitermination factor NusB [Ruminococcaceae bacterium]|nr:transcription antitermination factor NusB [Oscillospiraceae bacterium]MBR3597480.1 transcription antitermination factor NusB [Clostridia bacterium]
MKRSEAREQAFILVFEKIFNPEITTEDIKNFAEESELFSLDEYAEKLFSVTVENSEKTDEVITSFLRGWTLQRLPKVSLALLRLGVTEITYFEDTPDSVTANEIVELAKKYGGADDASFINGLLGSVIRGKE